MHHPTTAKARGFQRGRMFRSSSHLASGAGGGAWSWTTGRKASERMRRPEARLGETSRSDGNQHHRGMSQACVENRSSLLCHPAGQVAAGGRHRSPGDDHVRLKEWAIAHGRIDLPLPSWVPSWCVIGGALPGRSGIGLCDLAPDRGPRPPHDRRAGRGGRRHDVPHLCAPRGRPRPGRHRNPRSLILYPSQSSDSDIECG